MNTSTKWITAAATVVAIFFGTNVKAQTNSSTADTWHLGIGIEAGIPTGNLNNISNFELGGTARLQYSTPSNIAFMLTSGYYNAFAKSTTVGGVTYTPKDVGIIPVKAGLKAFANKNLYFSAEVGAGFETYYAKDTKLIVSPGIGYANYQGLDIGVRYENFSGQNNNYGLVGLRVAYGFKL